MGDMPMPPSTTPAMGGEHAAALAALLSLPVVVMALAIVLEAGARADVIAARRLRALCLATPPAVRLAAMGMATSAVVHLALAPAHVAEDPLLGVLFALDGIALLIASAWSLTRPVRGWRVAGSVLLLGGLLAYAGYVASGTETADAVGVATKLVELASLGLLVLPDGQRMRLEEHGGTTR
jgi:hypothetical protein